MLPFGIISRDDNNNAIGDPFRDRSRYVDHSMVPKLLVLLRGPEPLARTSTDHDGPNLLNARHNGGG
jgi:hypothetical protein